MHITYAVGMQVDKLVAVVCKSVLDLGFYRLGQVHRIAKVKAPITLDSLNHINELLVIGMNCEWRIWLLQRYKQKRFHSEKLTAEQFTDLGRVLNEN